MSALSPAPACCPAVVRVWSAAGVLLMYGWALGQDFTVEQDRTVALSTLVLFQAWHLHSSRSELRSVFTYSPFSNCFLIITQIGALIVHVAALYLHRPSSSCGSSPSRRRPGG